MNAFRRAVPIILAPLVLSACERSKKAPPTNGGQASPRAEVAPSGDMTAARPRVSSWDATAGRVLIVRADSPGRAYVVFPQFSDSTLPDTVHFDVAPLHGAEVELFGHAGSLSSAQLRSVGPRSWRAGECMEWPTATVATPPDTASTRAAGWSVAFASRGIEGVPLDSIEGLSPRDSARLAADITRLASALPGDTARAFSGIPFSVRNAYRFRIDSATPAIAADVVRKLPQEAMPLEEHTFLIAERRGSQERYSVVYSDRTSGTDESLVTTELLAAVRLPSPPRIALILLREGFDTSAYSLLERSPNGEWKVRWTSVKTGC